MIRTREIYTINMEWKDLKEELELVVAVWMIFSVCSLV
jgi:hypothetical protein